jgi:hypothetical protein
MVLRESYWIKCETSWLESASVAFHISYLLFFFFTNFLFWIAWSSQDFTIFSKTLQNSPSFFLYYQSNFSQLERLSALSSYYCYFFDNFPLLFMSCGIVSIIFLFQHLCWCCWSLYEFYVFFILYLFIVWVCARDRWLGQKKTLFFQILKDIPRMTSLAHLFQQKPVQEVSILHVAWWGEVTGGCHIGIHVHPPFSILSKVVNM